ncbi:heptaprenyl diphosphate synthase component 1 [Halalkalibacter okhensis]|uniref:Heptaprenyl diphosphate synthase n=1 Tax=Halalkalibacter okhensis TaxID=333138 RepID=A0A0B0IGE1_9BACI|nr:heptaprenyl diphosphate synthase component 1 [Halalkalibacter okhensis]KHF40345.1 heptaprenyl diphosphate synthase [Halalkalibacter okhensis]
MNKSKFNEKVKEIKRSFYSLTEHLYLQSYVPEPEIDDDKVRFLIAMMNERLPNTEAKMFTISALLLQAAFDMHDEVSLHPVTSDELRKNRQLTVLAGDYYVSLFYFLLAEKKHVPMIRIYGQSIQEINESKMNLYDLTNVKYDDLEQTTAQIESALMQKMANYFEQPFWKAVIRDFFYLKKLVREKTEWLNGKESVLIEAILSERSPGEDKLQSVERRIEDVKDRLLTNSKELNTFENFIIEHVDDLLGHSRYQEIAAEEG